MSMHDFLDSKLAAAIEREHELEAGDVKPTKQKKQTDSFHQEGQEKQFNLTEYEGAELEIVPLDEKADMDDKALARASIRNVLNLTTNNLGALLALAQATEHPRAFEVAATFAKTIVDAAGKLDDMASEKTSNKKGTPGKDAPNVQNNTQQNFYMSSEDAMRMIRQAARGENTDVIQAEVKES